MEEAEEFGRGYGPYDYLEASETFIREYLEENDWFTYVYDLGDYWRHRVTVEKVLEDYEYDYPQVIKYKGNCPPEDCGGIDGYYEYLEAIEDENYPDREERLEWLEMQGYPEEYDMAWTNQSLREEYFYKWGKREKRCQQELYEALFDGKAGLNATRQDKNKAGNIIQSGKHRLDETMKRFVNSFHASTKEAAAFTRLLRTEFHMSNHDALFTTVTVQTYISAGVEVQKILRLLEELDIHCKSKRQITRIMDVLLPLWNNTRMIVHRGFTPLEMSEMEGTVIAPESIPASKIQKDNVIDLQKAKKSKIYPNDPCPCGSGKKYKNCCKNKE